MDRRLFGIIVVLLILVSSCAPPPPIGKTTLSNYRLITTMRRDQFRSAAFLIDLRVDDSGKKYSVTTELYFSGDSIGIYGRGYLGKGTFKGNIIDDVAMVYFSSADEYYTAPLTERGDVGVGCSEPGEVLLSVLSLLAGKEAVRKSDEIVFPSDHDLRFITGRFLRTVRINGDGFPETEKFIDSACGDSIVFDYYMFSREFPFYRTTDLLYYNWLQDFRVRGFIREQQYNLAIPVKKFTVEIPASAKRLNSL
jgi:hypothetical protein